MCYFRPACWPSFSCSKTTHSSRHSALLSPVSRAFLDSLVFTFSCLQSSVGFPLSACESACFLFRRTKTPVDLEVPSGRRLTIEREKRHRRRERKRKKETRKEKREKFLSVLPWALCGGSAFVEKRERKAIWTRRGHGEGRRFFSALEAVVFPCTGQHQRTEREGGMG